jgi:hypothetical protein
MNLAVIRTEQERLLLGLTGSNWHMGSINRFSCWFSFR